MQQVYFPVATASAASRTSTTATGTSTPSTGYAAQCGNAGCHDHRRLASHLQKRKGKADTVPAPPKLSDSRRLSSPFPCKGRDRCQVAAAAGNSGIGCVSGTTSSSSRPCRLWLCPQCLKSQGLSDAACELAVMHIASCWRSMLPG